MANSVHVSTLLNHITHITCIFFSPHNADECSASFKLISGQSLACFALFCGFCSCSVTLIFPQKHFHCALFNFAVLYVLLQCFFLSAGVFFWNLQFVWPLRATIKKVYFYSFLFVQDRHSKTFTSVASPSHTNPLHVFHSHILFHRLLFYKTRYGFGSRGQQLLLL